jgi:hypothetical protein
MSPVLAPNLDQSIAAHRFRQVFSRVPRVLHCMLINVYRWALQIPLTSTGEEACVPFPF